MTEIKKICVIGLGRVGLPFSVSLHHVGFSIVGIDTNEQWCQKLGSGGAFPFHEPGYDTLPEPGETWRVQTSYDHLDDVDAFIVTVGTPLDQNLTPNLGPIKNVLNALKDQLAKGKLIIFRSTLGLGVTHAISTQLERMGACLDGKPNISYCPERLAEGKAHEELRSLPQIVSAINDETYTQCVQVFSKLAPRLHRVSYRQAELIKLLCNTSRYMQFAVDNWVHEFLLADGTDPHSLLEIANDGYPRPIPNRAGFTAGTCLRKDYGLLVQDSALGDFALAAWRVNERQPLSLYEALRREADLANSRVAILGIGFKKDVDDLRDSLALKLAELMMPHCKELFYHDPFVGEMDIELSLNTFKGRSFDYVRMNADVIVVGANHSAFANLASSIRDWENSPAQIVLDMWNATGFDHSINRIGE